MSTGLRRRAAEATGRVASTEIPAWVDGVLRPVDKIAVHRRALRHPAVSVFVIADDHLLIQRRAPTKYHTPDLWANTCCTHPHWGEPAAACAARRLREELGIDGLDLEHRGTIEYRADVGGGLVEHELVDVFVAEVEDRPQPVPDPDEVSAVRWVRLSALSGEIAAAPARFTPWIRIYFAEHIERILGLPARG